MAAPKKKKGMIRQNVSMPEDVLEMLRKLAEMERTNMSALITRWILERYRETPSPMIVGLDQPNGDKNEAAK